MALNPFTKSAARLMETELLARGLGLEFKRSYHRLEFFSGQIQANWPSFVFRPVGLQQTTKRY